MPFGKPKARKIETDSLPGPIATSYRRIFTCHEPDVERLMFVLDTGEITARFLASIMLCSLRELAQTNKIKLPILDIGDASTRLRKPAFGLWVEILRESARRLHGQEELFEKKAVGSLIMEISNFVFDENRKSKGRPYADLEKILVIRNKVHHPAEELDIQSLCEEAEGLLNRVLEDLSFFENFTSYVVKEINLTRRRLLPAGYDHKCYMLQGEIDFPPAASDDRDWHSETNEVLIYCDEHSYLNLDPLFVYLHSDDIDKSKANADGTDELYSGMYCFAGFAKKSSGLVVEYLPCATSTKSFRTSNNAFRDEEMASCMNMGIEELLGMMSPAEDSE